MLQLLAVICDYPKAAGVRFTDYRFDGHVERVELDDYDSRRVYVVSALRGLASAIESGSTNAGSD